MKTTAQFEGTITKLRNYQTNDLIHSELRHFDSDSNHSGVFGIKYVASGKERYILDKKSYDVENGQYLLINKGQSYECSFKSRSPVQGFCIGLDEQFLTASYYDMCNSEESLLDHPYNEPSSFEGFHQLVYSAGNDLSIYLRTLIDRLKNDQLLKTVSPYELFYEISVQLVLAHRRTSVKMAKLKARRHSTRKELFARLELAKQILESADQQISVAAVARQAALSEFHFYRSFKAVYGVSPHQFLLQQKLSSSVKLIKEGKLSITDIAYQAGFNDIYTYSRSFKQHFGVAPSKLKAAG